jgi:hypothetical protein
MSPWFSPEPPHPSVMFQGKENQEASEIKSIKENYVYQKHIKKSKFNLASTSVSEPSSHLAPTSASQASSG